MSKKYTAKQMNVITKDILSNAFGHMEVLLKELNKLHESDLEKLNQDTQNRMRIINATVNLINDVIHPAHCLAYQYFKGYHQMLDLYVKNQKLAIENKIVPECFNTCCDPDGSKSYAKAQELANNKDVVSEPIQS